MCEKRLSAPTGQETADRYPRPRRRRGQAAGSLIEVIIALFVIVTGILPALLLCTGAGRLSRQSQLQTAAYSAARQQLESLRAQSFAGRATATTTQSFTIPSSVQSQFPQARMSGAYVVTPVKDSLQQVTVEVGWQNAASQGYQRGSSVRVSTLIAKEPGR